VHCAGVASVAAVDDTPYAVWWEMLTVNVAAAAEVTRAMLPALRAAAGHVVFVNAAPSARAVPRWSAYTASKAAQRELADCLGTGQSTAPRGATSTAATPRP
jgi:NAD(P)-dependent dehydrogenase (short-subunit alcohol dehydrogenase family)